MSIRRASVRSCHLPLDDMTKAARNHTATFCNLGGCVLQSSPNGSGTVVLMKRQSLPFASWIQNLGNVISCMRQLTTLGMSQVLFASVFFVGELDP